MERPERDALLSRLQRDARLIADRFGLEYRAILAEHPRVKSRYGVCYQDGLIKIRLNHARTGEPLKYSSLIDTLCHELAHLKHFNHGPEFKAFFFRLLGWARARGIYQPGPIRAPGRPRPTLLPPIVAGPSQRNGVPIFPSREPDLTLDLPWMSPRPRQTAPTPNQTRTPGSRPRSTPPDHSRQLDLF